MFVHRHVEQDFLNLFSLVIREVSAMSDSISGLGILWAELSIRDNEHVVDIVSILCGHVINGNTPIPIL